MTIGRIVTFVLLLAVTACNKSATVDSVPGSHVLQIDNRPPVNCSAGVLQRKCLWVREDDAVNWTLFYYDIDGFTYEPGYRYLLEVQRETLPVEGIADALPYRYSLIRVIEKVKS